MSVYVSGVPQTRERDTFLASPLLWGSASENYGSPCNQSTFSLEPFIKGGKVATNRQYLRVGLRVCVHVWVSWWVSVWGRARARAAGRAGACMRSWVCVCVCACARHIHMYKSRCEMRTSSLEHSNQECDGPSSCKPSGVYVSSCPKARV